MIYLLDAAALREALDLPTAVDVRHIDWTRAALDYARRWYPDASNLDQCSFAGLVAYLATGMYGGFGTEDYAKERQIEDLAWAFAGGMPAPAGGFIAITPPLSDDGSFHKPLPEPEFTRELFRLLEVAYFEHDPYEALQQAAAVFLRIPGRAGAEHAREGLLRVLEKYFS